MEYYYSYLQHIIKIMYKFLSLIHNIIKFKSDIAHIIIPNFYGSQFSMFFEYCEPKLYMIYKSSELKHTFTGKSFISTYHKLRSANPHCLYLFLSMQ